ncbi:SGNH hydrolase-type esterase domain-containing protein [Calycina marina]|uniref:SGNH hydrolase-type esterase domain-containing protein n=1 Tax=Calycina marina TaxID=1763456 RepID=A0A9P7Z5H0_9HELO|nr:SGNH hydrolase-type esterase domain-containing protein [Calycina marina]
MIAMKALNILCFGDSITAGFARWDKEYHPYAGKMLEMLKKSPISADISTDIQGLNGDQVVTPPGRFLTRMDILYEDLQTPYDWAIILGGTNDLTVGRSAPDIWTGLKKVYAIPFSKKTKILAITVPECDCDRELGTRRNYLNSFILNHKAENFYTFDLNKALPYANLTEERRKELWSDGVHFTEVGYDLVGEFFAKRMQELITEARQTEEGKVELKERDEKPASEIKSNYEANVGRSGLVF